MGKKTKLEMLNEIKEKLEASIDKEINKETVRLLSESVNTKPLWELTGIFESLAYKLTSGKKRRKCLKEYVSTIKNNSDLKNAYVALGMVNNPKNICESKVFTDTLFRVIQESDKKNLTKGVDKIRGIVKESIRLSGLENGEIENIFESVKSPIGESLTYLFEHKCKPSNMVEWCNNISIVSEHINKNNTMIQESVNTKSNPSEIYNKLNELISESNGYLSDIVHSISECVLKGNNLESLFEEYKNDCINEIDKVMENTTLEEKARLESMKNSLFGKKYKEETLAEDLLKMSELKKVITESENK